MLLTGLVVPLKNGQKKRRRASTESYCTLKRAGRAWQSSIFFPLFCLLRCQRRTKLTESQIGASDQQRESCRNLFREKSATTLYSTRESSECIHTVHTYADTLILSTFSVKFCTIIGNLVLHVRWLYICTTSRF
jgi:hypothetical protein